MTGSRHPALISAARAIALAPAAEKLRVIEREAMGLRALLEREEIAKIDAVEGLLDAANTNGLDKTARARAEVEHVIGMGLNGIATLAAAGAHGSAVLPGIKTAAALQGQKFAPMKYVVAQIIPEGLTLLAGRPKIGKSWFSLDIALAVAAERFCLGDRQVDAGQVLYLALEDGDRRLQRRIGKILGLGLDRWPASFSFATQWPQGEQGIAQIEQWCAAIRSPRLVVIDVLAKFRAPTTNKNAYEQDYASLSKLQELGSRRSIAIVVVHHTRKGPGADDPVEEISGTLGLAGAADTFLVLKRNSAGAVLIGRGRDVEDIDLAVQFNRESCRWAIVGEASDVQRTSERAKVLEALHGEQEGLAPSDVAAIVGLTGANAKQLLRRMAKAGEIQRHGRGRYFHPDVVVTSVTSSPSGKTQAGGVGLGGDGDKVTEVTAPDWRLPLVSSSEGGRS